MPADMDPSRVGLQRDFFHFLWRAADASAHFKAGARCAMTGGLQRGNADLVVISNIAVPNHGIQCVRE